MVPGALLKHEASATPGSPPLAPLLTGLAVPAGSFAAAPAPGTPIGLVTTTARPGTAAAAAIAFALAQRGLPYVWGGDGPAAGDAGFDCSGLTTAAYAYAGITLPRTAHTQFHAGPHVPAGAPLEPGDLVFYGVPQRVHHVGIYLGDGRMINAPTFGKPVRLAYVRYPGDDYIGATRPAAGRDAPGLLTTPELDVEVPPVPSPGIPAGPVEFAAPPLPPAEQVVPPGYRLEGVPQVQTPGFSLQAAVPPVTDAPETSPSATATTPATTPATTTPGTPVPETSTPSTPTPGTTTPGNSTPASPAPATATPAPATTTPAPATATAGPPAALSLPGGVALDLAAARRGADGLPAAPTTPAAATMTSRGATTLVRLHPDTATAALTVGATVALTAADGTREELTVATRRTVDTATAAGGAARLVLVVPDPATGQALLVTAA